MHFARIAVEAEGEGAAIGKAKGERLTEGQLAAIARTITKGVAKTMAAGH